MDCDECDGAGREEMSLETIKLDKSHKHYTELRKLNPARAGSYIAQERAALDVVDRQVERLFGGK